MKTNRQVAEIFAAMINNTTEATEAHSGHLHAYKQNNGVVRLVSYNTTIAAYFPERKLLVLNCTRYSTTTSTKHQTHFYLVERLVYGSKVVSISRVDNVAYNCPFILCEYVVDGRYIAQDGQSWDNKPIFRVFDTVGKSIIKTYKIKRYAVQYADKLNEAQEAKRNY
jgi:hypothetical protein